MHILLSSTGAIVLNWLDYFDNRVARGCTAEQTVCPHFVFQSIFLSKRKVIIYVYIACAGEGLFFFFFKLFLTPLLQRYQYKSAHLWCTTFFWYMLLSSSGRLVCMFFVYHYHLPILFFFGSKRLEKCTCFPVYSILIIFLYIKKPRVYKI